MVPTTASISAAGAPSGTKFSARPDLGLADRLVELLKTSYLEAIDRPGVGQDVRAPAGFQRVNINQR